MPHDDLGTWVEVPRPAQRVVSLVPSLTEAIAASRPEAVVAATQWCVHPPDLGAARVRGTKNPDRRAIIALEPDLVVANREENRELDVRRLREAGVPVWVTDIRTLDQALESLTRLFEEALGWRVPEWIGEARQAWAPPPVLGRRASVAAAVWRHPWMWVGPDTFAADLLRRAGADCGVGDAGQDRYPAIPAPEVDGLGLDLVLLPDEPYAFTTQDGPDAFTRTPIALVDGRLLTWYGPTLAAARSHLDDVLRTALTP